MKGFMRWANEWRDKHSNPGDFEESGQQEAWVAGFRCARDHAARLIDGTGAGKLTWDVSRTSGLSRLIRAIGEAEVEETNG